MLQNLQRVVAYAQKDEDKFVRRVMENKTAVQWAEQEQAKRPLEKLERRINEVDAIIQRLYEDHVMGKLSAERFAKLSEGYEKEQADLKQFVGNLQAIVNAAETQAVNVQSFLKIVKKYTEPTELTPALLREFVEKGVVTPRTSPADTTSIGSMCSIHLLGRSICPQSKASTRKRQPYDALASCGCLPLEKLLYLGSP